MVLTHDDVEGRKLHGLVWHSQHHAHSSNLQGGQVELQWVLSTHSVNDTIQAPIDCLSSTRRINEMPSSSLVTFEVNHTKPGFHQIYVDTPAGYE